MESADGEFAISRHAFYSPAEVALVGVELLFRGDFGLRSAGFAQRAIDERFRPFGWIFHQ